METTERLGWRSVAELEQGMTAAELAMWAALREVEAHEEQSRQRRGARG